MNIRKKANSIYQAIRGNNAAVAEIRAEYAALALRLATEAGGGDSITNSTVNGQSFSVRPSIAETERFDLLVLVVRALDNDYPTPGTSRVSF